VLYTKTSVHLRQYLTKFFSEREIVETKVTEKIKTHILCSMTFLFFFFFGENRSVYEIMWKNMVESERPHMTNNTTHKRSYLHAG